MRSTSRNVLPALVAVLAFTAVATASASAALPEFTGSYPNAITIASTHPVTLSGEEGAVSCEGVKGTGNVTGAKALTATLTLRGCHLSSGESCTTTGLPEGEVKTENLNATLVYISKAAKEVGIDLNPYESPAKPVFAGFTCAGIDHSKVYDAVIGQITPVNVKTKTHTVAFRTEANGLQKPHAYENDKGVKVTQILQVNWLGSFTETAELTNEQTFTTAAETEIKA